MEPEHVAIFAFSLTVFIPHLGRKKSSEQGADVCRLWQLLDFKLQCDHQRSAAYAVLSSGLGGGWQSHRGQPPQ